MLKIKRRILTILIDIVIIYLWILLFAVKSIQPVVNNDKIIDGPSYTTMFITL